MRIIAKKVLREFWEAHRDAEQPLKAWYAEALDANWRTPAEIKERYRSASIVGDNRIVFNIGGNRYRLVVKFHYNTAIGFVRFIGTHAQYDRIDVEQI
jgi:mRNA interferase HigB